MAFDYSTIFSGAENGDVWLADGSHFQDSGRTTPAGNGDPLGSITGDQGNFNGNQTDSNSRPTLVQDGSGKWYFSYAGGDRSEVGTVSDWRYLHSTNYDAYVCIAAQVGLVSNPNNIYTFYGTSNFVNNTVGAGLWYDDRSSFSRNDRLTLHTEHGSGGQGSISSDDALPPLQDVIIEVFRSGASYTAYVNNVEVCSLTQSNVNDADSSRALRIGASGFDDYTFRGRIYGILITDTVPTGNTLGDIRRDMDERLVTPTDAFRVIYPIPAATTGVAPLEPKIDKFINVTAGRIGLTRLNPQIFPKFVPQGNLGIQGLVPRGTGRIRLQMPSPSTGLLPQTPTFSQVFRTAFVPTGNLGITGIAPLGIQFLESSLSDTADATDSTIVSLILAALGSSTADATTTLAALGQYLSGITDRTAANADTAAAIGEFPLTYADTVSATDAIAFTFLLQYADTGDVSDTLGFTFLRTFRELVTAVDSLALTGEYPLSVSSTGNLTDALTFVFPLYLTSTADATDTLDLTRLLTLISTARAQASSLSTLEIILAVSTLAHAQDSLDWARLSELADTGDMADTAAALVTAASQLADVMDATDSTSWTLALFVQLSDTAQTTDSVTLTIEALANLLSSGHAVTVSFSLDDTEDRYTGRVMNTETASLGWYTNVPFDALAWDTHTKNLFALKADGLYVFDADDDAGTDIDATLTTGVMNFQTDLLKRIDSAYIGHAGGRLLLQVNTTMSGTKQTNTYQMVPVTADVPRESVIKIGKGLKFAYCQFTLQNVDGADFEIDRMTVYPVTLSRRRSS